MKLEGIHHMTAITGDAPQNLDFYTRVLGLRLVKKTVNQDDPTVYHLFYADEKGSPGADLTFFEYPGAAPGRAGAGMVHRIGWRVGSAEALDFWADAAGRGGRGGRARRGLRCASATPRASSTSWRCRTPATRPLIADHPEVPAEHALQGFDFVRAYSADPDASRHLLEDALGFEPREDGWEVRGEQRGGRYAYDAPPRRAGRAGRGHRAPRGVRLHDGRPRGVAGARDRGRRPADRGDRPLLVPLDLLPRAERSAVRDRHARARLRRGRGARAPGREARAAAEVRAAAREDRGDGHAAREPPRHAGRDVPHRLRPAAGEPEGALVLMHGRATDENDLFPLLDLLDPERRLLGVTPARAAHAAARRVPLVRGEAGRLPRPRDVPPHLRAAHRAGSTGCSPSTASTTRARCSAASRRAPRWRTRWASGPGGRGRRASSRSAGSSPPSRGSRSTCRTGRGCRWRSATAAADPIIGVDFARDARERLEAAGADVTYEEHPGGHHVDPRFVGGLGDWVGAALAR